MAWEASEKRKAAEKNQSEQKSRQNEHCVFSMFCASGGSESMLAKAAGAEPSGEMWREAHLEVKMYHKVKNTSTSGHFCELRCSTSTPGCRAKHISKLKWTRHTIFAALLEVEMSKKCTSLWREPRAQI